jgi:hypothetical protein
MEPTRAHKLGALALIVLLVGLQLRAMLGPWEDWPFTSAPMFAFYHSADRPLYEIAIFEQAQDGSERRLRASDFGLREISFGRAFFGDVYGSIDPHHPAGHHPGDTPERFSQRMADFSVKLITIRTRNGAPKPHSLRYELLRIERGATTGRSQIGRFHVGELRFARPS